MKDKLANIPEGVQKLIKSSIGEERAKLVLDELAESLKLESVAPILVDKGKTYGDWNASLPDFTEDYRPGDELTYEIINQMIKSAPVRFALEMKRAQIVSVFRNERSWTVKSPDEELAEVVKSNLIKILPKMALDFTYSSLVYGTSFQELVWEFKNKYELGITNSKYQGNKKFAVARIPNSVNPETVRFIKRTPTGSFDGFVQRAKLLATDIKVDADSALVMPYNERFRNLWGESFLKPIYPIWFWYEVILRSMVRYMERTGTPVAMVKAPSRATVKRPDTGVKVDAITWGMEIASNVSRSNAAVIPSDTDDSGKPMWELSYLTSTEKAQPFMEIIELMTQMILRAGLSADRAISQSSGGVGSYNIGKVHQEATALHNETILIQYVHYLNNYFLPHYSLYNRGVNGPPIWIETQGLDPSDRENLTALLGIAANMESFKDASFMIDWETLFATNNIPRISKEEAEKMRQEKREEALANQEENLKIQQKFAPKPEPGKSAAKQAFGKKLESGEEPDSDTIELMNPYHRRSDGKFTGAGDLGTAGLYRISEGPTLFGKFTEIGADADQVRSMGRELGTMTDKVDLSGTRDKPLVQVCTSESLTEIEFERNGHRRQADESLAVAFLDWGGKPKPIVVTPTGMKNIMEDPDYAASIIAHETIHTRRRSQGNGLYKPSDNNSDERRLFDTLNMEEGSTQLLMAHQVHRNFDTRYAASSRSLVLEGNCYMPQSIAIASAAMRASNSNPEQAWKWVSKTHYHLDTEVGKDMFKRAIGKSDDDNWSFTDDIRRTPYNERIARTTSLPRGVYEYADSKDLEAMMDYLLDNDLKLEAKPIMDFAYIFYMSELSNSKYRSDSIVIFDPRLK